MARGASSKAGGIWLALYVWGVSAAGAVALAWVVGQWGLVALERWELGLFLGLAGVLDLMVVPVV